MRKRLSYILFVTIILTSQSIKAQNPFAGTWEYLEGNSVFQVSLYDNPNSEDVGRLYGDYKMITRINGIDSLIYKSNFEWDNPFNNEIMIESSKIMGGKVGNKFSGRVIDNTIDYQLGWRNRKSIEGLLLLEILPMNISCRPNCPQQISWKIEKPRGLHIGTADDYNIPTDIILTKVD